MSSFFSFLPMSKLFISRYACLRFHLNVFLYLMVLESFCTHTHTLWILLCLIFILNLLHTRGKHDTCVLLFFRQKKLKKLVGVFFSAMAIILIRPPQIHANTHTHTLSLSLSLSFTSPAQKHTPIHIHSHAIFA